MKKIIVLNNAYGFLNMTAQIQMIATVEIVYVNLIDRQISDSPAHEDKLGRVNADIRANQRKQMLILMKCKKNLKRINRFNHTEQHIGVGER